MSKRTQQESEQPAKVYQLDAVESKVDEVNGKLDKLLNQTSGLVTTGELSKTDKNIREYIDNKVEGVHSEYGPMKRNIDWFLKALILEGIAIVGQAIIIFIIANKG